MLGGSALLRVLLLIAAVGGLVGFSRQYWASAAPQAKPTVVSLAAPTGPTLNRTEPQPAPRPAAFAAERTAAPKQPPPAANDDQAVGTEPESLFGTRPAPREASAGGGQSMPSPSARGANVGRQVASADDSVGPRALDLVDLNTGSLAELNALKGGGAVGRAIMQHRPYGAIDQLLSKRVLSRAVYQRVRDQVIVR